MDCTCPAAGFCPVFRANIVGRRYAICRGAVLTPEVCEQYRQKWTGEAGKPATPPRDLSCVHRGIELAQVQCQTCNGNVQIKTFACGLHGECSLQKDVGVKVCGGCADQVLPTL